MQSKTKSHIEVATNQVVGIVIGWCIVYFIFPALDFLTQGQLATVSTVMFFIASYVRSYVIRRIYNK